MTWIASAILSLWLLPSGHYVRACRPDCEARAFEVAHAIEGAAIVHGIDPRVLVRLGWQESSLLGRDNATSSGVFGWHRGSRLWRECSAPCSVDEQAALTAGELVRLTRACGSLEGALSAWQSGVCSSSTGNAYAARLLSGEGP